MHKQIIRKLKLGRRIAPLSLVLFFIAPGASSDDMEIYETAAIRPKVLFLLDASGSMDDLDGGTETRLQRMKDAMSDLYDIMRGVDVGLMEYASRDVGGGGGGQLIHPIVSMDIQANRTTLETASNSLDHAGGTPSVAALYEAKKYFEGETPFRGTLPNGQTTYNSPSNVCDDNHVVLLTDGFPSTDSTAVTEIEGLTGTCNGQTNGRGTCGAEIANYMATSTQMSRKVTTHTIAFNLNGNNNWLNSVAAAGDGDPYNADSSQDLLDAFRLIVDDIVTTASAAAPTISVSALNESRHSNELYYSFFQPNNQPRWEGNVKKYQLVDGVIVGADLQPVVENQAIKDESVSLWAPVDALGNQVADGEFVQDGGMAAKQPAGRNWYTDAGQSANANGTITPLLVTAPADVPITALGASDNAERVTLVNWVRGYDSIDRNLNNNIGEPNRYVAEGLHTTPVLLSYKSDELNGILEEALFTTNNMGVVHAIKPDTGEELWSYSPEELLPNIKAYVDNTSSTHVYGLDGETTARVTHKAPANTTLDHEIDSAHLYITQRRGGNNIFALDVSKALDTSDPFKVMWKINGGVAGTPFRDLGQTWSKPQLIPINWGCPNTCAQREVLMFSGGYNPVYDNRTLGFPVTPPATGHGHAIYLVDPDTGALLWSAGNNSTRANNDANNHALHLPVLDSIPATPVPVDTDADGAVDILYFSDIGGHIWRIDLDQKAGAMANIAIAGDMIADLNESGQALRFFNRPDVVISGTTNGTAKFNIVIGSGMRSSPLHSEANRNRLFVIKDRWVFSNPVSDTIDASTGVYPPEYRYIKNQDGTRAVITPGELWDYDLNDPSLSYEFGYFKTLAAREKVLAPTLTHAGKVFLVTYMPPPINANASACEYRIGESRLYLLDLLTGDNKLSPLIGNPFKIISAGIANNGSIVDTGDGSGPDFVVGINSEKVLDLLAPDNPDSLRRIFRTGWSELDY